MDAQIPAKKRRAWAKQKKLEQIAQGEQAALLPTISRSGGDSHSADQPSTYSAISHNASQLSPDSGDSHPADDAEEHSVPPAIASAGECATTLHAQPPAMLPALPSSSWPSGDLHPADSPNPDAPAKSKAIDATGNTASIRKVALASDTERGGAMRPSELKEYATRLKEWSEPFPIKSESPYLKGATVRFRVPWCAKTKDAVTAPHAWERWERVEEKATSDEHLSGDDNDKGDDDNIEGIIRI